jgi:hypothetical protein
MLLLCAGSIFLGGTRWIKREREKEKKRGFLSIRK